MVRSGCSQSYFRLCCQLDALDHRAAPRPCLDGMMHSGPLLDVRASLAAKNLPCSPVSLALHLVRSLALALALALALHFRLRP